MNEKEFNGLILAELVKIANDVFTNEIEKAPSFGYCASQGVYYYGSLVSTKKS